MNEFKGCQKSDKPLYLRYVRDLYSVETYVIKHVNKKWIFTNQTLKIK